MKAAKALKEKGETPEELLQSIRENESAVAEAQRVVDAWKAIVGEKSRREEAAKAEAERIATEKAEAERKAAEERERAEKEEKARIEAERKAEEERKTKEEERKERDENGQPFVVSSDGTTTFGEITEDTGLTAAPIKLSEGVADEKGNGYGLRHIEARHGDQIRKAGFSSVEEFIEQVAKNYDVIKEGSDRNGNKTYRLLLTDKHNNTLMIELSKDGSYWNVNTAGVFKKSYGKDKKEVYNRHTTVKQSAETAETSQADEHSGTQSTSRMNVPTTSADKGSEKPEKKQEKQSVFDKAKEIADKEEKKRKAEAEDDSVLGQATRAVGKKKKVNLFKYTASKIISYPALRGVHYANGYAYASDGYILFKEKADYPKDWEGTTRDKDGNLIDGKYPDTEKAIHRPVYIPDKEAVSLPSKEVLDFAIAASKKLKGEAIPVAIDGMFFNAVNLKKFLEAVASKGMDKVVYRHPMLYATNGKDEIVLIPTVNTLEGALDIADKMESVGLPKEQIDAWKAHIEAADKKMSLEDFKKAVENAKKEGVRHTEAEKPKEQPLTEAERKDAEEVAGALGYRVEWVDTMEENGTIDADKKVIRIAKDAENPLVQVLGHEVAHGVKQMDGGKFKALQKAAMEVVGEKEWNERIEKKHKLNAYAEGKLAEEVTCDIVGEALNDKDALKRLAESLRGERGILARLRDAVVRMVEYFKNRGDKDGVRRMKAADKLLSEFESALKEGVAPEQVKPEGIERSVRESRSEKAELTAEERELRDNLVERMRKGGLDVVTDSEEMQRVIDTENERTRNKRSKKSEAARKRDEALYAVDWSTAFVSGKSREEATEIRRERGRKFKEETKELYGRVLSGNFDDVTLRLIDEFIDKSTPNNPYGRPLSKRLPPRVGQKMRGGERTGSIDALFSRISESAVGKDGKALPRAERERAIEEKKKELLKKWAIATGNWHTDVSDFSDGKEPIGSGTDSDVYLSKDGKSVIKVSKGKPYGKRFRPDVDNVALFNTVFPGSRYTIEGYGEIDGKFVRFLKQPFVDFSDSTPLTEGERVAYMEKLGFKPINKENTAFSNGEIVASDLQKSNVVRDRNGNVRVIDADMKLHTKDVGGNYSYPDVETDTTGLAEREEVNTGSVREHRVYHGSGADFDAFDHSHMGEGEGAQAYGWGTYVTEVEGIGRTYAIQNTTKHNDALRALQHDVDAISDQLNRHRDDLKYDEEQLKRANEWRAEAELDYELFKDEAEKLKEKYGESSPKYQNHLFYDIYTDEMKRAQSSVKSTEESIQYRKEKIAELEKALKDKQAEIDELPKEFPRHLYTVEIPDDNGSNYLDWNGHPAESLLKGVGSFLESNGFERVQDSPVRYEKGESTVVLNPNATGADLYAELREALGSDKKASQALAELGCIGIKYPADNMRGGRKDGAKNYVIFNENDAKITDHTRFLRTASGEVYGLVKDGRIYLDPKVATSETAVHEYTHLWGDMLRRKDSEQWSHTVKELKNSVLWEEVKELYPELKTDDEIADEVLSTFSGRRGAERLREEARRVAEGDGGVFTKAKAIETLERVKEAIARFWEGVARMFGINRYRSAEELADMAMRDLINGVKPTSRTFTFDNFYKDTKAVFEGTERPKGKPDYTSYSGSEYWYGEDKGGKYVVRGSDHWSGEFKVKDGERTNVGRNHYSEITEDGMLPIGAQGSLKFGWGKGLSKPVGSGISAAIDRRGSGDSNNIASCYWYIDNAKEKDNKGFTYGIAYLSEFEDKERRRDIPGDDWRDIQGLEGGTRAMAERIAEQPVEEINNRFNEELEKYQNNELPKGHRFELGMPSAELQSAGFPTLPISMRSSLLAKKAGAERHPFAPTDLRDLVNAIQKPIAIFNYSKNNMRNLIVDVSRGGKHFLVGVTLNYKADNIEINSVSGLFPKENHEWIKWIQDGKVLRIDQKEKVQDLINSLRTNPAESERIGLNLDDVAKKVKDFENPKLFGEEIIDDGKKGSDSTDRSVRENPKNEDKPRFSRKPGESIFDYASRVSEDVDRSVRERVSARDEYEKKVKSKGFQTKEALQNSMLGLQEFMLAIDHASGNKRYIEDIPDFENLILGENRLSSVNKEESHSRLDAVHSPMPTKGVRKPYLRSYTMIYMPLADIFFPRMYQAPDGFMAVRIALMYYVDFYSLFNNPEKEWDIILSKAFDAPSEPSLFD